MSKKFYITTPIYYPSASPHLGHAYCSVMADIIRRSKALMGYDTYFLTGLDEHGEKIEKNAISKGMSPQEFVDSVAKKFLALWKLLGITNDDFIRTTQPRHVSTVQEVFSRFLKEGDVYLSKYKGWYCVHEETFWTETQVGKEHVCPECGRPVEEKEEEAYFFSCGKHLPGLLKLFEENPIFITPTGRKTEMINNFIAPGLNDLCVTRTTFRWGIPVKEDEKHVVYVWLDALLNYVSALGYLQEEDSLFRKFWQDPDSEIVHLVGADITRFHTIYWPMFLESLGLRAPNRVFVHGLMMMKDGKMSKSKGNVVYVEPLVERYGVDAVRYYLASEIVFGADGQFTPELFVERLNADLANNLGNLLNRTVSMIGKYFGGDLPATKGDFDEEDRKLSEAIRNAIRAYGENIDSLKVTEAYRGVMDVLSLANKYIDTKAPWALAKDPAKKDELASTMGHLAMTLRMAGVLLSPILIRKAGSLFEQLGIPEELRTYDSLKDIYLPALHVEKGAPLFPRLDVLQETEWLKGLMASPKEKAAA